MANEIRKHQIAIGGLVENTDGSFATADTTLESVGLSTITGGVVSTEHMAITVDPDGIFGAPEICYITALTAGASSATVTRAQEGTTARDHVRDTPWVAALTRRDIPQRRRAVRDSAGDITSLSSITRAAIDATNLPFLYVFAEIGDIITATFSCVAKVDTAGKQAFFDFEVDRPTSANTFIANANDQGLAVVNVGTTASRLSVTAYGSFVVTERGLHGLRPVYLVDVGTTVLTIFNTATGAGDHLITFMVEDIGPEKVYA